MTFARIGLTIGLCAVGEAALHACPICFQIEDAHVISGVRAAVVVLMGVTVVVVAPVVAFAIRLGRRERNSGT